MTVKFKSARFLVLFLILVSCLGLPVFWMALFAFSPLQADSVNVSYIIVKKGQTSSDVTRLLVTQGAIADGKLFLWLGRITRLWKNLKAGEYEVSPSMSPLEIFSTLTAGISAAHPITVHEGDNLYEIADSLFARGLSSRDEFISLCKNPDFIHSLEYFKTENLSSLEGYLFPDTYFFNRTMTPAEMIKQMVKHFFENWSQLKSEGSKANALTRHQIVTLASIVEKETGAPEERPLISSVFHNRLKKGMKLQSDPTTIYGMWDRYAGKIKKTDLLARNLYNTYSVPALPIGPISNPGKEALQAALFPAESPYYFFVSHNDGTHQFSVTYDEHTHAVRKFQLDPKAREGKSWRDRLSKLPK